MPTKKFNEEKKRMNKLLKQMRNRTPKRSKVGQAKKGLGGRVAPRKPPKRRAPQRSAY